MTITQLRYFIVAAQTENLLKAAAALYISQSSLSKNIAALEKELGVDLFDRNGKSLRLNEAGGQFLASCQKMLGEFDNVLEGSASASRGKLAPFCPGWRIFRRCIRRRPMRLTAP